MITIPGFIPITIRPSFWIFALILAFFISHFDMIMTLIWVGIIFVSVLFHEMGHALTARAFGRKPRIELIAMGGVTFHDGDKLPFWKQFIIVLNGPVFGFLLFLLAYVLLSTEGLIQNKNLFGVVQLFGYANLFWTVVNVLPVMPLDGGQLMRIIFESIFGIKGIKYAFLTSAIFAVILALVSFLFQAILMGAFFFLFAYQGYEMWKQSKMMAAPDQKDVFKDAFEKGEKALAEGKKEEARAAFEKIRTEAKQGVLYVLSTQYLAFLEYEAGNLQNAYDMLMPLKDKLAPDALALLHRLAFELKNYSLTEELAGSVFQTVPSVDTALRNAYASALLGKASAAVGWLETAHQEGLQNIKEVILDHSFDSIRQSSDFQNYIANLK